MEQQQRLEIGQRIRDLRNASAHTNRSIADHVGVGERAVANWIAGKTGIAYENARAVADLFKVDVDWLWSGRDERPPTPDLSRDGSSRSQLDRIEAELADLRQQMADLLARDKVAADQDAARSSQRKPAPPRARSRRKSS